MAHPAVHWMGETNMFGSLNISTSGLVAQRVRMDVVAGNIANAFTTADAQGQANPYRRRIATFAPGDPAEGGSAAGVHVAKIATDPSAFRLVYDPSHPQAMKDGEKQGYVQYPNVDLASEMVNGMEASRAYEANLAAYEVTKSMISGSMRLLA
jgi:flagellar basal-body rod protein FlgC